MVTRIVNNNRQLASNGTSTHTQRNHRPINHLAKLRVLVKVHVHWTIALGNY